jgi:hypothetical protein
MKACRSVIGLFTAAVLALTPVSPALSIASAGTLNDVGATARVGAQKDGWQTVNGKTYYYKNGKKVTGLVKITQNGTSRTYAFNNKGELRRQVKILRVGKYYYTIDALGIATRYTGAAHYAAARLLSDGIYAKKTSQMLWNAFVWSANKKYALLRRPNNRLAEYYGQIGLTATVGDMYAQTYAFYWMAKLLGYDVKVIQGYVKSGSSFIEHVWCEIKRNDKVYVCDPNYYNERYLNPTSASKRINNPKLGYMCRYGTAQTLKYSRSQRDSGIIPKYGKYKQ